MVKIQSILKEFSYKICFSYTPSSVDNHELGLI